MPRLGLRRSWLGKRHTISKADHVECSASSRALLSGGMIQARLLVGCFGLGGRQNSGQGIWPQRGRRNAWRSRNQPARFSMTSSLNLMEVSTQTSTDSPPNSPPMRSSLRDVSPSSEIAGFPNVCTEKANGRPGLDIVIYPPYANCVHLYALPSISNSVYRVARLCLYSEVFGGIQVYVPLPAASPGAIIGFLDLITGEESFEDVAPVGFVPPPPFVSKEKAVAYLKGMLSWLGEKGKVRGATNPPDPQLVGVDLGRPAAVPQWVDGTHKFLRKVT
jgi:hypothetical protein